MMSYWFAGRMVLFAVMLGLLSAGLAACTSGVNGEQPTAASTPTQGRSEAGGDGENPGDDSPKEIAGTVPAPDFPADLDWLNVSAPPAMEDLRGKVVLLDFWTYGCINCMHMFPILERLEDKYADELVVIGVHSAKFANEGETDNIRQIIRRYDLRHPVINDSDFRVWGLYGVRAWPSFAIIDPRGQVYAIDAGEIPFEAFDRIIGGMVAYFDSLGEIDRAPLDLARQGDGDPDTPLLFPGKVLADEAGNRLFIADSNHHRIVVADLTTYEVLDIVGAGRRGLNDGDFEAATFNKPQGMALDGSILYVADTNNHAIRAIDLDTQTVSTIAGTGVRGTTAPRFGEPVPEPLTQVNLRSPWDVEMGDDSMLYIAMAGTHQIWSLDLDTNVLRPTVGNGRESLKNGSLRTSELAQPSGLYYADGLLYFADSESSSIRVADFNRDEVRTLAGPLENTLFDFGDVDGAVGKSRLQHPLGVVGAGDGLLYVADTYNSKIKAIDLETDETTTLFGMGETGGFRDGGVDEAQFDEPGGLDYAGGRLYVADTNNHAIRVIDLAANTVSTVTFPNPEALRIAEEVMVVGGNLSADPDVVLPEQRVAAGEGEIVMRIALPDGFKINDLIDSTGAFSSNGDAVLVAVEDGTAVVDAREIRVPVTLVAGSDTLYADLTLYYCQVGEEALCLIENVVFEVPVVVSADGGGAASEIVIEHVVVPPEL
jgi:thiol-disulfide isomerase/thioredoxin